MKKATLSIMMVMAVSLFAGAQEVRADDGSDYRPGECVVTSSNVSGAGTLKRSLDKYNNVNGADPRYRGCTRLISFAGVPNGAVNVTGTLNVAYAQATSSNTLTIDGAVNGEATTPVRLDVNLSDTAKPVFLVKNNNRGKVVIKNMVVSGTGNAFLKCEQGASVELVSIEIANTPSSALIFEGCNTVKLTDVTVTNGTTGAADMAVIDISGATTVTVSNVRAESSSGDSESAPSVKGVFLQIVGPTETSVQIVVNNLASGTAAYLSGLDDQDGSRMQLTSLDVTGSNVQHGVVLNYVDGSATSVKLNLVGRPTSAGIGLVLDQGATRFTFDQSTSIEQFGGDGVQIRDSSDNNKFNGVVIQQNRGNGINIVDDVFFTSVVSSRVVNNAGCGIVLATTQGTKISGTQLQQNGTMTGCPIEIVAPSPVQHLADSDVILIPTSDRSMQLDVVPTLLGGGGGSAEILELHRLTRSTTSSNSSSTAPGTKGKKGKVNQNSATSAATVVSGDLPGQDDDPSLIGEFNLQNLPAPVDRQVSDHYFAILTRQGGEVVSYWKGKALGSGTLNISCYEDPTSGLKYRVYEQSLDTDDDGLYDHEEDKNMNCEVDTGETSPDTGDTDGDGLGDRIEVLVSATDPQNPHSDGDGLKDGEEDLNGDGSFQAENGETDPMKPDTDEDGLSDSRERALGTDPNKTDTDGDGTGDGTDLCPNLHKDQGICYYAFCAEGLTLPNDQDSDEDGIRDDDEDTHHNCQRDLDETDANNPDTDGDGISDGVEDYNQNGKYEPGLFESNPLNNDTDGDGIGDGVEDKFPDGKIESGRGETSPILTDSDGDTLLDNVEDKNKNGVQDPGETSAALADTDGDGMNDNVDPSPWSVIPNSVVFYCGVSGFDQDTDGDGLNDKDEDYNGDCLHTAKDKEPHPLKADTDADGLDDGLEECYGTNPNVVDTDGDGRSDFDEVKSSGLTCTAMYNLGSTNPLRAEYGSCSLNTGDATSGAVLPIILMMALAVIPMVVIRRKKM